MSAKSTIVFLLLQLVSRFPFREAPLEDSARTIERDMIGRGKYKIFEMEFITLSLRLIDNNLLVNDQN